MAKPVVYAARMQPRNWYALGTLRPGGWFRIRKFVSGRVMCRYEKREGEVVVPVDIIPR